MPLPAMNKKVFLLALAFSSAVNFVLSIVVQVQKYARETGNAELLEKCFDVGGGCATVQSSSYANTFGISNPLYGIVFFAILTIIFSVLAFTPKHRHRTALFQAAFVITVLGSMFSLWLLYVQFFLLHSTCVYCLWVDGIMIVSAGVFLVGFWKEIHTVNAY